MDARPRARLAADRTGRGFCTRGNPSTQLEKVLRGGNYKMGRSQRTEFLFPRSHGAEIKQVRDRMAQAG
jgi:hypothetical protein